MTIFSPSPVGRQIGPVLVEFTEDDLLRFASVIGESDPLHVDPIAARAAGYAGLLAPPTFAVVLVELANAQLRAAAEPNLLAMLAGECQSLVHGEEVMAFHSPVTAGQTVEVCARIVAIDSPAQGRIWRARVDITLSTPGGGTLVTISRTMLRLIST
jgi:acyl dehydratase